MSRATTLASTPEQARELLTQAERLTSGEFGKVTTLWNTFGEVTLDAVPVEVAEHFPDTDDSSEVTHTLYVKREKDMSTRELQATGMLADITISQREQVDEGLLYVCRATYRVVGEAGEYSLERHITASEHGFHMVRQNPIRRQNPQIVDGWEADIIRPAGGWQELLDLAVDAKSRVDETRPMELASGLLIVSAPEADQILEVLEQL